jgi:hypothetical protein
MYNFIDGIAMKITPEQLEIFRKSAREREKPPRARLEARRQHAWKLARKAAPILRRNSERAG